MLKKSRKKQQTHVSAANNSRVYFLFCKTQSGSFLTSLGPIHMRMFLAPQGWNIKGQAPSLINLLLE